MNRVSVSELARRAGVGNRKAREWLQGRQRKTQQAKDAALEAAYASLGGTVVKQDGDPAFLEAMGLRVRSGANP